ncbi:MAG: ABC transporter ATP-binding protein [Acidimicrobiales bacterium]
MTTAPSQVEGRALHLRGVGHTYPGSNGPVEALGRVELTIDAGEFVCLVGPSGCGKSTLLEIVAGLRSPSSGSVTFGDRTIVGPSRHRCVVFQQSSSLMPWLTVRGNVELGLAVQGVARRERRGRAEVELERVGLSAFADHRVYELSGGMQQRCQIARALAVDPEVLLLDEPFGALDALTRETLQSELRNLWLEHGRTVLFVTHSIEEAALLASRVLVMSSRPGTISLDRTLSFTRSGRSAADLRADPEFVAVCHDLRTAITHTDQEPT